MCLKIAKAKLYMTVSKYRRVREVHDMIAMKQTTKANVYKKKKDRICGLLKSSTVVLG